MPATGAMIDRDVFCNIVSFLDDSSHVVGCGPDIANMGDLNGLAGGELVRPKNIRRQSPFHHNPLYRESMESAATTDFWV